MLGFPIEFGSVTKAPLINLFRTVGILEDPVSAGSVVFEHSAHLGLEVRVDPELLVTVGELTITLLATRSFANEDMAELRLVAGMPPPILTSVGVVAKAAFRTNPLFDEAFTHFGF